MTSSSGQAASSVLPDALDREFPRPPGAPIYCNAAAIGPLPTRTVRLIERWSALRVEPWRVTLEDQFGSAALARERAARLIRASTDEIALVSSTTAGLQIAAAILPIAPDRVVLGHDGEFPANVYPWMELAARGGPRFEQIPLADGLPDHDALVERLGRGDVGAVALSWVSFVSGDRVDLARVARACREHGAWLVVDAIQGAGAVPLHVRDAGVDVLACGAQKWLLSPWGSGFLYVRREIAETLEPHAAGWLAMEGAEDLSGMLDYELRYAAGARRFEAAPAGYQDVAGMAESLGLVLELGVEAIHAHVAALAARLVEAADAAPELTLLTPRYPARRAGIVSFRVEDAAAMSRRLENAGVVHSVRGRGVIRLSPHLYNSMDEMDRIAVVLRGGVDG